MGMRLRSVWGWSGVGNEAEERLGVEWEWDGMGMGWGGVGRGELG